MTKVRESQIPEQDGKVKKLTTKKITNNNDSFIFPEEDDEEEEVKLKKVMISFNDGETIISAYDLHTIEKDIKFVEKPKAHWEFGISINKNLIPGQFITKTDISFWYMKESVRDEKYAKVMEILKLNGLKVIEV